jgi:hypothetical protein
MTEPRVLGVATEYSHLVSIALRRLEELGMTFEQLDLLAGVSKGFSQKVLNEARVYTTSYKKFGPYSFGAIMGALGIVWRAIDDPAAVAKHRSRADAQPAKRQTPKGLGRQLQGPATIEVFRALGAIGGRTRFLKLGREERRQLAVRLNQIRWDKERKRRGY